MDIVTDQVDGAEKNVLRLRPTEKLPPDPDPDPTPHPEGLEYGLWLPWTSMQEGS